MESAILRVEERIEEERLADAYSSLGKGAQREAISFRRNLLREFLLGIQKNAGDVAEKATVFGFPCRPDTLCRGVWVQVQKWNREPLEYGLLMYAIQNMLSELLGGGSGETTVLHLEEEAYFVVTIACCGGQAGEEELCRALERFCRVCREQFHMEVSCYLTGEPAAFSCLPGEYLRLQEAHRNNVARNAGVLRATGGGGAAKYEPDFPKWGSLLDEGCGKAAREEIHAYLKGIAEQGALNREFLSRFHEDFLELFFAVIQKYQAKAWEIFSETYDYDAMLHANASLPQLLEFVGFAAEYVEENHSAGQERAQIDRVLEYIRKNLLRNIGRGEIAKAVYLNPEYLSRLFKKEMGLGLNEYLVRERMKIAGSLLKNTSFSIGIVASKVGYVNFSHFARAFKKEFGMSPSEYRESAEKEE